MNVPTSPAIQGAAAPANSASGVPDPSDLPSRQFQQLANDVQQQVSVMEQNRAKIDQGWEELARLDQVLASLDSKLGDRAKELRQAKPRRLRTPKPAKNIQRAA